VDCDTRDFLDMARSNANIRLAVLGGAFSLLVLLGAGGATGWWVIRDGAEQRALVDRTHEMIEKLLETEAGVIEAVTERNLVLSTAGVQQSDSMELALERASRNLRDLSTLMRSPAQRERLAAFTSGFDSLAARLRETVELRERGATQEFMPLVREAAHSRRALLRVSTEMTEEERRLLTLRAQAANATATRFVWLFGLMLAFALAIGGLGLWALYRHLHGAAERYKVLALSEQQAQAANAALAESQGRLQSILDHARDPILVVEEDQTVSVANQAAAEQFGLPVSAMIGQPIQALVPAFGARSGEVLGLRPDGTSFPAEISIGHYADHGRNASVCVLRDVTERRRLEQLKSEFVSTVSHELRTPLTSIRASLGLIAGGVAGEVSPEVRELLDIAYNNSERLVLLVNDILDMEKIESGRLEFRRERLPARRILEQSVEANRAYGAQFGVSFKLEQPGGPDADAAVYADAGRIQQVLANLLSNAAKFSPRDGVVEASLAIDAGNVTFRVRDHGKGIPPEFRDRIFQRFAQADSSDVRQKGGTGLGLSISKAIVEHHGGQVGFEDAEGGGTLFWFTLPRLAERLTSATPAPAATGSNRRRALIVEDDADVALLLSRMLGTHGWDSEVARNATEAFESLDRATFDAMTLDLMLPDEDGLSVFRRLRQRPDGKALPVIVISAIADQGKAQLNGDAVGVVDWLDKPIDQLRLRQALRQALHNGDRPSRILHVEDDHDIVRVVSAVMGDEAQIVPARTLAEARGILAADHSFGLVIVDVGLPDGSGLDLLGELRLLPKPPQVLIFSASDYDSGTARHVAASLVKSRTENRELHETIRQLIEQLPPGQISETQP
jgi:signal transduction histidine kinase/DNA-binding response OmpR family regulator